MYSRTLSTVVTVMPAPSLSRPTNFPSLTARVPKVASAISAARQKSAISESKAVTVDMAGDVIRDLSLRQRDMSRFEAAAPRETVGAMSDKLIRELERRMKALDLNPLSTATKAKLGKDAVRDIIRGKSLNPSHDTLGKIARALGCTVADLTGERQTTPIKSRDSVVVFEVNTGALSGMGNDGDLEIGADNAVAEYTFPTAAFQQIFGAAADGVIIEEVRGDSNIPTLWPGQRVMINLRDRKPSPPGFFLCWDGLGMVLKRVEVIPGSNPQTVRLISDNPKYSTYERTLDEAHIYGRVVGSWNRL